MFNVQLQQELLQIEACKHVKLNYKRGSKKIN